MANPTHELMAVLTELPAMLKRAGYWQAEVICGSGPAHEITLRTKEGYEALPTPPETTDG